MKISKTIEIFFVVILLIVFAIFLTIFFNGFNTDSKTTTKKVITPLIELPSSLSIIPPQNSEDFVYCPFDSGVDTDGDGLIDPCDNCPDYYNPEQIDNNYNGIGDVCDFGGDDDDPEDECDSDLDCGVDGFLGQESCSIDENVVDIYKTFTCNDPEDDDSTCSSEKEERIIENCNAFCIFAECRDLICDSDSDCDDSNIWTEDQCINPGLLSSYCENTPIECFVDSDCNDGDDFTIDRCRNAGLVTSYCTNEVITCNSDSDCDDSNIWTQDSCINPGLLSSYCNNAPIECFNAYDCDDGDDFTIDECHNAGLVTSYCNNTHIGCFDDWDCDDSDLYTFDNCLNPGLVTSYCDYKTIECFDEYDCHDSYVWTNDICVNPGLVTSYCDYIFIGDCYPGETRSCGESNLGECSFGTETCQADGTWGYCVGAVYPETEVCNDLDDDCDGNTDEGGVCVPTCQDECINGLSECFNGGVRTCGNYDSDSCTEWSNVDACDSGYACDNGECFPEPPTCTDECTLSGETQCIDDYNFLLCGHFDFDECLEWSDPNICGFGFTCSGDTCMEVE